MSDYQARVSVAVAVPQALAFEVFTEQIDQWWRRGPKFRHAGLRAGLICLEPGLDGRLFETFDTEEGPQEFECGRVLTWLPPSRLVFSWRNATFAPHELTRVEVDFLSTASGTLITVTRQGWDQLPANHPARHGLHGSQFARMLGLWWGDQLSSLRRQAASLSA